MSSSQSTILSVFETQSQLEDRQKREKERGGKLPSHWVNASATEFRNPWPSWRFWATREILPFVAKAMWSMPTVPKDISTVLGLRKPSWGLEEGKESSEHKSKIKATWLGHACLLVELPSIDSLGRGPRILFDPVFSDRCAPTQMMGPKRYTPMPCSIEEIPEIDAIVISHNHYDHLDTHTITSLFKRSRQPHIFAPLGNQAYFSSLKIPSTHNHILDWWETRRVQISLDGKDVTAFDVTCTPAQHMTGRGLFDRFKTLWASWAVESVPQDSPEPSRKVYFAGDTGYRAVKQGEDEESVPICPAFKEIGERFGGFDLAMIPIGAYQPRHLMSPVHCAPQDSVRIFQDIKAKRALGMHWGTWVLTIEDVMEPPRLLAEECKKADIEEGRFDVCGLGETSFF